MISDPVNNGLRFIEPIDIFIFEIGLIEVLSEIVKILHVTNCYLAINEVLPNSNRHSFLEGVVDLKFTLQVLGCSIAFCKSYPFGVEIHRFGGFFA